jgi:rod shape-determining protein MreC
MRPNRVVLGVFVFLALLVVLPVSKTVAAKTATYSILKHPLAFSRDVSQALLDLLRFSANAEELRRMKREAGPKPPEAFQLQEALLENDRLNKLLEMRRILPAGMVNLVYSRVIARSPAAWNRVFMIDKGSMQGMKADMPVLADSCLIGKVLEAGPAVSKVLLVTDPNSRVGALIQRTRDQGMLYGTFSGECRLKYLSLDAQIQPGDIVESAGHGGFLPKGLLIGKVEKVWKEPGQIYQVALVKPFAELSRVEEVACLA